MLFSPLKPKPKIRFKNIFFTRTFCGPLPMYGYRFCLFYNLYLFWKVSLIHLHCTQITGCFNIPIQPLPALFVIQKIKQFKSSLKKNLICTLQCMFGIVLMKKNIFFFSSRERRGRRQTWLKLEPAYLGDNSAPKKLTDMKFDMAVVL